MSNPGERRRERGETLKSPSVRAVAGGFCLSASRFCPNCGRPVPPENAFCTSCGFSMSGQPAGPSPGPAAAPGASGVAPPAPAPAPYGYPPPAYPGYVPYPRPANLGNILSGLFDVWSKNFLPFFAVYLVMTLVTGGLGLLGAYLILGRPFVGTNPLVGATPTTTDIAALLAYELVVGIIGWIVGSVVLGGVVDFSLRRYRGENARIQESLSKGFQRVLSIMGANLLVTMITVGVFVVWVVVLFLGVAAAVVNPGAGVAALCGGLIALPFILVIVLYLVIALNLYAPAIMAEGSHAIDSLGRSWNLTKGHKWSLFGAILVTGILSAIVGGVIAAIAGIGANPIAELIGSALAAGITGAWAAILSSVAYDLITRTPQPSVWPPTYAPPYPPH